VRELPNDAPRQALLRDELGLAPHAAVAFRIEELEDQRMLVVEQRDTAVEHELAVADARGVLVQAEGEPRCERALTEHEQLLRRMHDVAERAADRAPQADAEHILGGGIQIRDVQRFVEHEQRRRKPLQDVIGGRSAPRAPAGSPDVVGRRRPPLGGYRFGLSVLVCCTKKTRAGERMTSAPAESMTTTCNVCSPRKTSGSVTRGVAVFKLRRWPSYSKS